MVRAKCIKVYKDSSDRITGYKLIDEKGNTKNFLAKEVDKAISTGKLIITNEVNIENINSSDIKSNKIYYMATNDDTETDSKIKQYLLDIRALSYDVSSIDIKYGGKLFEDNYSEINYIDTWYVCKIFNGKLDKLLKSNGITYLQQLYICIDAILNNMSIEQIDNNKVVFFIKGKEFVIGTSIKDIINQLKLEETYISLRNLSRFIIEQKRESNILPSDLGKKLIHFISKYDAYADIDINTQNNYGTVIINNTEIGCCLYTEDKSISLVKDGKSFYLDNIGNAKELGDVLNKYKYDKKFILRINEINQELLSRLAVE